VRLAEADVAVDQLCGPRHDEEAIAILLDLRALVRMIGVLDREVMQLELPLHAGQDRDVGLVQADPDDVSGLAAPAARFLDRNVGDASAVDVDAGGDHTVGRNGLGGRHGTRGHVHGSLPLLEAANLRGFSTRLALEIEPSNGYVMTWRW
jgi:hypothetical protein